MIEDLFFYGIGGIGMSALAHLCLDQHIKVQGVDCANNDNVKNLQKRGVPIQITPKQAMVSGKTMVYSTAIKDRKPDLYTQLRKNSNALHRAELLARCLEGKRSILVAGTHGKTSTTSMLTHVLHQSGLDPSYAIGGHCLNFERNGYSGSTPWWVAEADESDGSFLSYFPYAAIVTNLEKEHLDYWENISSLKEGFRQFTSQVRSSQRLVWSGDDPHLVSLGLGGYSYGIGMHSNYRMCDYRQQQNYACFTVITPQGESVPISMKGFGIHQALNAVGVFAMGHGICGLGVQNICEALATFRGVKRRMELKQLVGECLVYDDYAHHPTEVVATLSSIKAAYARSEIVAVFQPHRFSRLRLFYEQFIKALRLADKVIITDIYACHEKPIKNLSSQGLCQAINCASNETKAVFIKRSGLSKDLIKYLTRNSVVVTLGAGDISNIHNELQL